MSSLIAFDNFDTHEIGEPLGNPWRGNLPTVQNVGRNGGKGVAKTDEQYMLLDIQKTDAIYAWACMRVDALGRVVSHFNAKVSRPLNSLTCRDWLLGLGDLDVAHVGVVATDDGALHIHRGTAFDATANNTTATSAGKVCTSYEVNTPTGEILASSAPGVIPIGRGWFVLELLAVNNSLAGSVVVVRVNNQQVASYSGEVNSCMSNAYALYPCGLSIEQAAAVGVSLSEFTGLDSTYLGSGDFGWMCIGGDSRGARPVNERGWSGVIDMAAAFSLSLSPSTEPPVEDINAYVLTPTSTVSGFSDITGTSPAATRHQSVDDIDVPDDAVTQVTFNKDEVPTQFDLYGTSGVTVATGTGVYGITGVARVNVSNPGYCVPVIGHTLNGEIKTVDFGIVRTSGYKNVTAVLSPPDGFATFTASNLASINIYIRRDA